MLVYTAGRVDRPVGFFVSHANLGYQVLIFFKPVIRPKFVNNFIPVRISLNKVECLEFLSIFWIRIGVIRIRAVDLHSFFADPDPAVFLNADPDPAA